MHLYRICYRSRINWTRLTHPLADEIDRTLTRVRRINRRAGVTGALLLTDDHVIQVLEGQPAQVLDTFFCVMSDPRLSQIIPLIQEPVDHFLFPNSLMYFRDLTDAIDASDNEAIRALLEGTDTVERNALDAALRSLSAELDQSRLTNDMLMI